MNKALGILGLVLLMALPAYAVSNLKLTCTAQGLTPGAHVWIEVAPQYQAMTSGELARGGFRDLGPMKGANARHAWNFEIPAGGAVAPVTHKFEFPASVALASGDHSGTVLLKTRFRIDDPARPRQNGYGEIIEQTFAMPAPAGVTELSRCLRLRQEGTRLSVETAADCREATFSKAGESGIRIRKGNS